MAEGTGDCAHTNRKMAPRQAAKCPKNTLVALETPLRVGMPITIRVDLGS